MAAAVAVVGAGVCGLSTAVCILQRDPNVWVTVIADKFYPDTCTDGAAGVIMPWTSVKPLHLQRRWFRQTREWLQQFLDQETAPEMGLFQVSGYGLFDRVVEPPEWRHLVPSFHELTQEELADFPPFVKSGYKASVTVLQGGYYLRWLMTSQSESHFKQLVVDPSQPASLYQLCCHIDPKDWNFTLVTQSFQQLGGVFVKRELESLGELSGLYDVIVNCSGMGARQLVKDNTVEPIRGQVLRVEAPFIKGFYFYDCEELTKQGKMCYIIPQIDEVVLGGTKQLGDFNETPTAEDTAHILKVTSEFVPSLKRAKVVKAWAGLRPNRPCMRVEKEVMSSLDGQGNLATYNVVHNYGQGGTGLTVHWGCALDSTQLVFEFLKSIPSKL